MFKKIAYGLIVCSMSLYGAKPDRTLDQVFDSIIAKSGFVRASYNIDKMQAAALMLYGLNAILITKSTPAPLAVFAPEENMLDFLVDYMGSDLGKDSADIYDLYDLFKAQFQQMAEDLSKKNNYNKPAQADIDAMLKKQKAMLDEKYEKLFPLLKDKDKTEILRKNSAEKYFTLFPNLPPLP